MHPALSPPTRPPTSSDAGLQRGRCCGRRRPLERLLAGASLWATWLRGATAPQPRAGGSLARRKDFPLWASRDRVSAFRGLSAALPDPARSLGLGDNERWGRWARSEAPEREFSTAAVTRATTAFQRLLIVQVLRPDRLLSALQVRRSTMGGM